MIPDSNKQVIVEKEAIMEQAMLNALAFAAITGSPKDEISEGQAWKQYGKAWIRERTECGDIHFMRNGVHEKSTKVYSRFEIECQKRAEKKMEQVYRKAAASYKSEQPNL